MDQEGPFGAVDLIAEATEVLDELAGLKIRAERPQTFLDIAGVSRREVVCSSILAFFLDPEGPHGLGTLVLDALADAGYESKAFGEGRIGGNVYVESEVPTNKTTDKKKRIDILVRSDDHVILIENKTARNARIDNPLDAYAAYQNEIARGRSKHRVLLTVTPSSAGREEGFDNLTYTTFVRQMRLQLGRHVSDADTRYLTLFLDFLNTLENLKEGTRLDRKLVAFLAKRRDGVVDLLKQVEDLNKELEEKGKELQSLIDVQGYRNIEQSFYCDRKELFCDLVHNVRISKSLTVCVEASVFPNGWQIWMWPHDGDGTERRDRSQLGGLLKRLEIPADEYYGSGFLHRLSYDHEHDKTLKFDEGADVVAGVLQGLLGDLARERGATY